MPLETVFHRASPSPIFGYGLILAFGNWLSQGVAIANFWTPLPMCLSVRVSVCPSVGLPVCPCVSPSLRLSCSCHCYCHCYCCPSAGVPVCPFSDFGLDLDISLYVYFFLLPCLCEPVLTGRRHGQFSETCLHRASPCSWHGGGPGRLSACPSLRPSLRLCPSVRPSVRLSVRLSVCPSVRLCPSVALVVVMIRSDPILNIY